MMTAELTAPRSAFDVKASGAAPQEPDLRAALEALRLFLDPAHFCQVQALPTGRWLNVKANDYPALERAVRTLHGEAGLYVTLNPIVQLDRPVKTEDVVRRRHLLIDVDRFKTEETKDLCATEEERDQARAMALDVLDYLNSLGWPAPVQVDSGNGWYLLYRVDLPADTELVRGVIRALRERCDDDARGEIDRKVVNAGRIFRVPGTWNRKGKPSKERPHRMCKIQHLPDNWAVVPTELLEALAGGAAPKTPPANGALSVRAKAGDKQAYGQRALDLECGRVAMAPVGERNDTLFRAAINLAQLKAAGVLTEQEVKDKLFVAAVRSGLAEDDAGERGILATINSGYEKGVKEPRQIKERKADRTPEPVPGAAAKPADQPTIYKLTELLALEIPEPRWAVPGLLSEGLSILAGKPKLGKSWVALNLALTIAAGGMTLGSIRVQPGNVLYLALEDKLGRIQKRARKVLGGLHLEASDRLEVAVAWPRQHEGGLARIREWVKAVERPTLVIVDVWAKLRPPSKANANRYDEDYEYASALKQVMDEVACSSLLIHHTKKAKAEDIFDEISGSLGLTGAADGSMVLARSRNENEARLAMTGRDIDEKELALKFDPATCVWTAEGTSQDRIRSKTMQAILGLFRGAPGATFYPSEVAELLNLERATVKTVMWRMANEGHLKRLNNKYAYPLEDQTPDEQTF